MLASNSSSGLTFASADTESPWRMFLEQIDRVVPHLGRLAAAAETLRRAKRARCGYGPRP